MYGRLPDAALLRRAVVPGRGRALPAEPGQGGRRALRRGATPVELISFGDAPRRQTLAPGVTLRVLPRRRPAAATRSTSSRGSCPTALADADLVHIHQAYTRCSRGRAARRQAAAQADLRHRPRRRLQPARPSSSASSSWPTGSSPTPTSARRSTGPPTPIDGHQGGRRRAPGSPRPPRPATRDRVLYVGRLLPHKGIDRLIAALPPELPLTVCGRPYRRRLLRRLLQAPRRGQARRVRHRRRRRRRSSTSTAGPGPTSCPRSTRLLRQHATVAPELMGFTLLEAMACGTPGDRLAGRRRCPSSSARARPASSSTTPTSWPTQLRLLADRPRAGRADGPAGPARRSSRSTTTEVAGRQAARRLRGADRRARREVAA